MDKLILLASNYSSLMWLIEHLGALVHSFTKANAPADADDLLLDLVRLADLLEHELLEHFDFADQKAFPQLKRILGSRNRDAHELETSRRRLLTALHELRTALAGNAFDSRVDVMAKSTRLDLEFERHVHSEIIHLGAMFRWVYLGDEIASELSRGSSERI